MYCPTWYLFAKWRENCVLDWCFWLFIVAFYQDATYVIVYCSWQALELRDSSLDGKLGGVGPAISSSPSSCITGEVGEGGGGMIIGVGGVGGRVGGGAGVTGGGIGTPPPVPHRTPPSSVPSSSPPTNLWGLPPPPPPRSPKPSLQSQPSAPAQMPIQPQMSPVHAQTSRNDASPGRLSVVSSSS